MISEDNVIRQLRALFRNHAYSPFFVWASGLVNDVSQTPVSRIEFHLEAQEEGSRKNALDFCNKLKDAGCGKLILGRHGKKSRMQWAFTLRSIGAAAKGEVGTLEPREMETEQDAEDDKTSVIRSEIPLSGATRAILELPEDLSELDVLKLIDFIKRQVVKKA
jgi:hypothetical protein